MINKTITALACLLCLCSSAQATIIFTATGTATNSALGFNTGDTFSISYTLADFTSVTPVGDTYNRYFWYQNVTSDPNLWSTVTLTNSTGQYTAPLTDDVYNFLIVDNTNGLYLWAGADTSTTSIGLTVNGHSINSAYVYLTSIGNTFSFSGTLPDPNTYFNSYIGTYTSITDGGSYVMDTAGNTLNFTVTSLSISVVPEPSDYAAFGGMFVLGAAMIRRRMKRV